MRAREKRPDLLQQQRADYRRCNCLKRSPFTLVGAAFIVALFQAFSLPVDAAGAQFVYDAGGRLIQVIDASGNSAAYSYDAAGNLLSTTPLSSTTAAVVGFSRVSADVGNTITIYGSGFSTTPSNNTVSFNGISATVLGATANALTVQVPTGASTGLVTVVDSNGTAVSSTNFVVAGSPNAPTITSFTPQLADWGTSVTLSGTGFSTTVANNRVSFAGQVATITSASSSTLVATVPDTASSGRVTVTTNAGTAVSAQDLFVPRIGTVSDLSSTTRVTVGGSASTLAVSSAGKNALAIFDGSAGEVVSIAVSAQTFSSACSAGHLWLYGPGPDNAFLAAQDFCVGQASVPLPVTGTYTLVALPVSTDTGSLTLTVSAVPIATGTIQIGGGAVTVTTSSPTEQPQLTFASTQARQVVSIGVTGVTYASGCSQQILKILGPAPANPVVYSGDLCGTQSAVLGPVGTYTLEVIPFGTDTGAATLSLANVAPVTDTLIIDGSPVTVSTSTAGQQAVLTFTTTSANEGVTVQPSSDSFPSWCGEQSLMVAGPGTSTKVLFTQNLCTTRAILLPTVGTYTLTVVPTATDTGGVTLQLTSAPLVSSAVTIGGAPVTLTTTIPAQAAQWTFTTTSNNQSISVQPSGCTLSDCWDAMLLVSGPPPAKNYIKTIYLYEAAELIPAPLAGTYTITLIPYDTDSGSLTLTLQNAPPVTGAITIDGSPVTLSTTVPAQQARWTFSTTAANQRISIQGSGATYPDGCSAGRVELVAIPPTRSALPAYNTCPGSWAHGYTVSAPGSYVLTFFPSSSHLDFGSLTVQLQNAPDVTGTLSINGSAQTETTTVPAQNAVLSFTSTVANQAIRVLVSGSTYPSACYQGNIQLYETAPNTTYAGGALFCSGTTSLTLGDVETYQLRIEPYNTDTGSITVQVLSP